VLTAAAAGVALLILRVVSIVMAGRLQNIPGGPPFWMTFDVSYRTVLFVAALAVAGAAVSGLVPALQATGRLAQLGATWTTLVIAQVAFSVAVLPLAAQLAWGTLRTGFLGPGFAAEEFATARVALEEGRCTRHVLLAAQVALALVLLVGSGPMIRTVMALRQVDPGGCPPVLR
jgi:hypothetical protein